MSYFKKTSLYLNTLCITLTGVVTLAWADTQKKAHQHKTLVKEFSAATITQEQLNTGFSFRYKDWLQPSIRTTTVDATLYVKRIDARLFEIRAKTNSAPSKYSLSHTSPVERVYNNCLPGDIAKKTGYDIAVPFLSSAYDHEYISITSIILLRNGEQLEDFANQYADYKQEGKSIKWTHVLANPPIPNTYCSFYKSHLME